MFFFRVHRLPLFIAGVFLLFFARAITNLFFRSRPDHPFNKPILREVFYVWTTRVMGIMLLVAGFGGCQKFLSKVGF
jgi:hypothetical protein